MALRVFSLGLLGAVCVALASGSATGAADDKKPQKQDDKKPQVILHINIAATDTKDTQLPEGTDIRIRMTAGMHEYIYEGATIVGETVGDIAQQIYQNMKTAGWNVTPTLDWRGVVVTGYSRPVRAGQVPTLVPVGKAGINYSGKNQPVGPKFMKVQQQVWQDGQWKDKQ